MTPPITPSITHASTHPNFNLQRGNKCPKCNPHTLVGRQALLCWNTIITVALEDVCVCVCVCVCGQDDLCSNQEVLIWAKNPLSSGISLKTVCRSPNTKICHGCHGFTFECFLQNYHLICLFHTWPVTFMGRAVCWQLLDEDSTKAWGVG